MSEDAPHKSVGELGAWVTDTEFEFFEPITMAPGMTAQRIDIRNFVASDNITPDEIVEAVGNQLPSSVVEVDADDLVPITCSGCGRTGRGPREMLSSLPEDMIRCPACFSKNRQ